MMKAAPEGSRIGWVRRGTSGDGPLPVEAIGADGRDRAGELFVVRDGSLETRSSLVPIMMTTHPAIALGDCLFYAVTAAQTTLG